MKYIVMILIIFGNLMQLVAIKLQSLLLWIDSHFQDINNCLANYPYNHFRGVNTVSSFKILINQIIDFIIDQLYHNSYPIKKEFVRYAAKPVLSVTDITFLSQIKTGLEDMRYSLLMMTDKKYNSVDRIKMKLRNMITLTCTRKRNSSFDITKDIHNDKSKQKSITKRMEGYNISKSPAMKNNVSYEMFRNKESEQEKATRIRRQLYQQMNNRINTNRDLMFGQQRNRILSDQQDRFGRKYSNRINGESYSRQIPEMVENKANHQPYDKNKIQRKRYNYLEKYQNLQKNTYQDHRKLSYKLDSPPYQDKYKSLPSTESKSQKKIFQQDPLGEEIHQITAQLNLGEVQKKLNFESLLQNDSKVQEEQMHEKPFIQDSIEHESNLSEDSLELMKKQEHHLNQTGCFVIPQPSPQQLQHLEYSFCRQ